LLLGETQQDLDKGKDGFVGGSGDAYKKMYPKVRDALLNGEKVTIEYSNINFGAKELSNKSQPDMIAPDTIQEKLSEINGNLITLNAKLEDKNII
jgi:hypothetical protein